MPPDSLLLTVPADPGLGGREESSTGTVMQEARRRRWSEKAARTKKLRGPGAPRSKRSDGARCPTARPCRIRAAAVSVGGGRGDVQGSLLFLPYFFLDLLWHKVP